MAVAIQTPAIGAFDAVNQKPFTSEQHQKVAVGYTYGGTPRYVTNGQSDTIVGPGGVIMLRREAVACDLH